MHHKHFITILCLTISSVATAKQQHEPTIPEIGKPCPEFSLDRVLHYSKSAVKLSDFKSKWLILDFWTNGCVTCITSFPKISKLQAEFKDRVQFLLVGKNDKSFNSNIEQTFEKVRAKQGLNLPVAYDSVLMGKWDISGVPHIVIVDPQGIVRHITSGRDMTSDKIAALVNGEPVTFFPKRTDRQDFDPDNAGLPGSSESKVLYRSVLTAWNGERQKSGLPLDDCGRATQAQLQEQLKTGWTVAMVPLYALYNYAYVGRWTWRWDAPEFYGKVYHHPILNLRDSSLFAFDYDRVEGPGLYSYNLMVPIEKITQEYLMNEIRHDLKSVFGYNVITESRQMPVWKLVATPDAIKKLKTKGGKPDNGYRSGPSGNPTYKSVSAGFTLKNQSVSHFIALLTSIVSGYDLTPFLDATTISDKIDIEIDADLSNFNDIQKALRKKGLEFRRDTQQMKVVVITEGDSR